MPAELTGPAKIAAHVVAAAFFVSLLGAPFSLTLRKLFSRSIALGLVAFAANAIVSGVDLLEALTFYGSYHSEWRNQIVHIIFVPVLVWSGLVIAGGNRVVGPVKITHVMAAAWSAYWIAAEHVIGAWCAALVWFFAFTAERWVAQEAATKVGAKAVPSETVGRVIRAALAVHVFSWYMQLHPGHAVFEGRKPALLNGLIQAFMDAPLFVWFEAAFKLGYRPELAASLDAAVTAQHAAWAAAS